MEDLALTLTKGEAIKVFFYQGKILKSIFIWMESESILSVSVKEAEKEVHVIEILSTGKIITTKES